jgi:hypothetical protein
VAFGQQVSTPIGLTNAERLTVWCPVVTSCALRLLGSFDPRSANFVPVHDPISASGRTTLSVGPGSLVLMLGAIAFPFVKLDVSVAQAAPRSFAIVTA